VFRPLFVVEFPVDNYCLSGEWFYLDESFKNNFKFAPPFSKRVPFDETTFKFNQSCMLGMLNKMCCGLIFSNLLMALACVDQDSSNTSFFNLAMFFKQME